MQYKHRCNSYVENIQNLNFFLYDLKQDVLSTIMSSFLRVNDPVVNIQLSPNACHFLMHGTFYFMPRGNFVPFFATSVSSLHKINAGPKKDTVSLQMVFIDEVANLRNDILAQCLTEKIHFIKFC